MRNLVKIRDLSKLAFFGEIFMFSDGRLKRKLTRSVKIFEICVPCVPFLHMAFILVSSRDGPDIEFVYLRKSKTIRETEPNYYYFICIGSIFARQALYSISSHTSHKISPFSHQLCDHLDGLFCMSHSKGATRIHLAEEIIIACKNKF